MTFWSSLSRPARWLLLASLCINVALVSYVSIQWLRPPVLGAGLITPARLVERVAARLPQEDAEVLRGIYRAKEPELMPLQAEYVRALARTVRIVGQPNLDPAALRAAAKESRDRREAIGDRVIDIFLESLERISPEGRRRLVSRFPR